jgi:protein-tyrosine-phosphatase
MKRILFVCTGNTCRSCMAEALAKKALDEMGLKDKVSVSSAGIYAFPGDKASSEAVEAMREYGIDIKDHCARRTIREDIDAADIILAMTRSHKQAVIMLNPSAAGKVFTLGEYAGTEGPDIEDPFGGDAQVYRECAGKMDGYIRNVLISLI